MTTKVELEDVRLLLRWLRDQPMDLERMEAELVEWFRKWQQDPRGKGLPPGG